MPTFLDTLLVLLGMIGMAVVGVVTSIYLVQSGNPAAAVILMVTDCFGIAFVYGGAKIVL
jgi:hypothetical protein